MPSEGSDGAADWLVGDSPIAELIRTKDWSQTPLGPLETWPESLRTTVSLILASSFPLNLLWGDGAVQIWNESYAVICGAKHPVDFGSDYRVCWESAWPAIGPAFEEARAGRAAFLEDQPMFLERHGFLEETWFTFCISPITDEAGEVAGLFLPVTETTPRMLASRRSRAQSALSDSVASVASIDEALATILSVCEDAVADIPVAMIYLTDDSGVAVRRGAVGEDPLLDLLPAEISLDTDSPIADAITALSTATIPAADGVRPLMVFPIVPPGVSTADGALVLGVSEHLALDEVYRGFLTSIAQTVTGALTIASAREQERERLEALAELDRAKSAFFADVSHEFRTPLTLMLGPLEEELNRFDNDVDRTRRLAMVHRNGLRLLRLVNSLLDFSRADQHRSEVHPVTTDLATFTRDLVEMFRYAVESGGLALNVECEAVPAVGVDRTAWERIVLNLMSNAFKHTFDGSITVGLSYQAPVATLTVSDTGIGIGAEAQETLFDRFQRVKGARSRSIEGTGIGLALVQHLARLHGGDVVVESVERLGTTFTVTIQALASEDTNDSVATPSGAAAAEAAEVLEWVPPVTASAGSDVTRAPDHHADERHSEAEQMGAGPTESRQLILLVDDNADMRRYVGSLLEPFFDVETAVDGQAAVDRLQAGTLPDLVLSDVMMPRLDGFGLLRALRADERTRVIPMIMLSARAGEQASVEGIAAGVDDYLAKPFSAPELIARVTRSLDLARVRRESEQRLEAVNAELSDALVQLQVLSRTDPGTGLPNKRTWSEELHNALLRSEAYGHDVCVGLIDLDHLKAFNDRYGHQAGDSLLLDCGVAWRMALPPTDLVARIGGDEFAVLLPERTMAEAQLLLDKLSAATPQGQTVSIGLAQWDGHESLDAFVARADVALYSAKHTGRGRTVASTLPLPDPQHSDFQAEFGD